MAGIPSQNDLRPLALAALALLVAGSALALPQQLRVPYHTGNGVGPDHTTDEAAMLQTVETHPHHRWDVAPLLTIGETLDAYRPAGVPDGMGAMPLDSKTVRIFVNHELNDHLGYPYTLANGTELTGARVSYFDLDSRNRKLLGGGMAYDTIIDRYGEVVTSATQINEGGSATDGMERLCSASLFEAGTYSLVDDVFMTGEETGGGQEFVLDVHNSVLYCAPWLGRAAWENMTFVDTGDPNTVGVLVGDDRGGAPLLLYVGQKDFHGDGGFLDRNGLAHGALYAWVADDGSMSPEDWNGTGTSRTGTFVEIAYFDAAMAGMPGYDAQGFADQDTQDALVAAAGGFQFSRPEDVATSPEDGTQVVLASTGRSSLFPSDAWGTTYLIDLDFGDIVSADISVLYDGDDAGNGQVAGPDYGLRSPDNLDWADDGMVYVQEDRSVSGFGLTSGMEASVWKLDPWTGELTRILSMDRSAVPTDQHDPEPDDIGNWESSGVIDVTGLFQTSNNEVLLLANVQAHSLVGEPLGGDNQGGDLVQGGQIMFLSSRHGLQGHDAIVVEAPEALAELQPNFPNPFNPSTTISFSLKAAAPVKLEVFNVRGELVRTLMDEAAAAGRHSVVWDGRDATGGFVSSGTYFSRLATSGQVATQRMTLLK